MINIDTVQKIHNILIEKFGGSKGLRDKGSLLTLARPDATFDQQDFLTVING